MKITRIALALSVLAAASSTAHAQSSVTLYGILDAGLMYTNNVGKPGSSGRLIQATSGTINGDRFGLRGAEDLGGGLKAVFVLENGFNIQSGKLAQDGREFGRQAFVGLSSTQYGTVTLGRQYDSLVDYVAPLSATAGTFGDTGFAHPFDNDNLNHSVRFSNAVKYQSNNYAGFKFGTLYSFSNATNFAANRAYSFGASYAFGPLNLAAGYLQTNGSNSTNSSGAVDTAESAANGTGGFQVGSSRMRSFGGGAGYVFGPVQAGFVYTHSQYVGTSSFGLANGSMSFNNFDLNAKYALSPAVSFGIADVYTSGHLSGATTFGEDPKFNQVDLQAVYSFSKRTDVYAEAMYQHAIGDKFVAFVNSSGGASSTANQVVGTVGVRTRF